MYSAMAALKSDDGALTIEFAVKKFCLKQSK